MQTVCKEIHPALILQFPTLPAWDVEPRVTGTCLQFCTILNLMHGSISVDQLLIQYVLWVLVKVKKKKENLKIPTYIHTAWKYSAMLKMIIFATKIIGNEFLLCISLLCIVTYF